MHVKIKSRDPVIWRKVEPILYEFKGETSQALTSNFLNGMKFNSWSIQGDDISIKDLAKELIAQKIDFNFVAK